MRANVESTSAGAEAERQGARRRWLGALFAPETIALVDARGAVGQALARKLRPFPGRVVWVGAGPAGRAPVYPEIGDVPGGADLALLATPPAAVRGRLAECVRAGVQVAVILTEGGIDGAGLREVVAGSPLRVLGPGSGGVIAPHLGLHALPAAGAASAGPVAFLSQSAALAAAVVDWSARDGVGLSAVVALGQGGDIGWGDLIAALGADPRTRSILIHMEAIGDARAFLSAAREVAFTKPVIVVKTGRTEGGARVAAPAGAPPGSDAVLDAAFRRVGVLRVETIAELFDMAEVLGRQPGPRGPRLAIVSNAGGPAGLAADQLARQGGRVAVLAESTRETLLAGGSGVALPGGPVDLGAGATPGRFAAALRAVVQDSGVDGVLALCAPVAGLDAAVWAAALAEATAGAGKPVLASWLGAGTMRDGRAGLAGAGIPVFETPERAAQAFVYLWRYAANLTALYETPLLPAGVEPGGARRVAEATIRAARRRKRAFLTEVEAKTLLAAYGIAVVQARPAFTEAEAVAIAGEVGFPVTVKAQAERILQPPAGERVVSGVRDAAAVREAWRSIRREVTRADGAEAFRGVTLQPMPAEEGIDLRVGSTVDAQFGPVIFFGAGGRWSELWQDEAPALPPLTTTLARRLMERTRVRAALSPEHGLPAASAAAVEDLLVRFSQLIAEQPAIAGCEINPLRVTAGGPVVLDARVRLHASPEAEAGAPPLAIRPYPQHYTVRRTLKDGTTLWLRAIRPEDEPTMVEFHHTLSDQSVYYRYFAPLTLAQRTSHERLARLCFIDYDREMAIVAVQVRAKPEILGVGRLCKAHGRREAEFAVIVADPWQGRRLGTLLLERLIAIAREEGLVRITGTVLRANRGMRAVAARLGFTERPLRDETELQLALAL